MSLRIKAGHAFLMDHDIEAFVIGIHCRMQDTDVRADADEMDLRNTSCPQLNLQIRAGKGAVTRLIHPVYMILFLILFINFLQFSIQLPAVRSRDIMRGEQLRLWMIGIVLLVHIDGEDDEIPCLDEFFGQSDNLLFNRLSWLSAG